SYLVPFVPLCGLKFRTLGESLQPCPSTLRRKDWITVSVPGSPQQGKLLPTLQSRESTLLDKQWPTCRQQNKAHSSSLSSLQARRRPSATFRRTRPHPGVDDRRSRNIPARHYRILIRERYDARRI